MNTVPNDERKALANQYARTHGDSQTRADFLAGYDEGFRRQGPITDAQVDAALAAWWESKAEGPGGQGVAMRAALEAARDAS